MDLTTAIKQLFISTNTNNCNTPENKAIFDFEYADEDNINEDLICPICLRPVINPTVHADCGNMFCKDCIDKSLAVCSNKCPVCTIPITRKSVYPVKLRMVLNQLNDLKVMCPNCNSICTRSYLAQHCKLHNTELMNTAYNGNVLRLPCSVHHKVN